MDAKRSINTRIWSDPFFESLEPDLKLLWLYFLCNEYTNMLGIYELSIKRISFDTGLSFESVSNALKGFERVRKAFFIDGFLFLPNFVKNQSYNPNMEKGAQTIFDELPKNVKTKLLEFGVESFESLRKGLQTLSKIEIEIEIEIKKEIETNFENQNLEPLFENSEISIPENEKEITTELFPIETKKEKKEKSSAKKESSVKIEELIIPPFKDKETHELWQTLCDSKKWKKKASTAVNLALRELLKYPDEEFQRKILKNAVVGEYQGLVFASTDEDYQKFLRTKQNGNTNQNNNSTVGQRYAGASDSTIRRMQEAANRHQNNNKPIV